MTITDIFKCENKHRLIEYPYIIAEAGVNHECSMDTARKLIDEAAEGGADAIKFQSYKADTIASKDSPYYWDITKEPTKSQYELFKKHDKFWKKEFEELKLYCDSVGIDFMSTPFDVESATFLNDLMDVYKISSSDITNKPFIEYICSFKKPLILSTGASNMEEINDALGWIKNYDLPVCLMHCILNYPTEDTNANLGMICDLRENFPDAVIGYSDHTLPKDMRSLELATMLGAKILEKHFTHDKTLKGNDHYHAMDIDDLKILKNNLHRDFELLGSFKKCALESEGLSRKNARRSLVAAKFIKKNSLITKDCLTWKRPASGISPKDIDIVVGSYSKKDIAEDTIITPDMISR